MIRDGLGTEDISRLISSVGTETFYPSLFQFVGSKINCERWILVRYGRFSKSEFLINSAIPDELVDVYMNDLYHLDPLLRVVAERDPPAVTTFEQLCQRGWGEQEYRELYRLCDVHDELIIFMPEFVGTYMAFCFDRDSDQFTPDEVDAILGLYPTLNSLHRLHFERSLNRQLEVSENATRRVLLTSSSGEILHRSSGWTDNERTIVNRIVADLFNNSESISPVHLGDKVLHWERLPDNHHLAPHGRIFLLETINPGYLRSGIQNSVEEFLKFSNLTRREQDLVNLTLRGYPTSTIAEKLDLTIGTVKVYKHRIYDKLNITSEREIFIQFIEFLFYRREIIRDINK